MRYKKTVLITGASSGIGLELSKLFAGYGYNLVLVARNKKKLEQLGSGLENKFGILTKTIPKDLSIVTSPYEIFAELQNESIDIDILVNNAGFQVCGSFSKTDLTKEIQMIQTNLVTLTQLTKLFLPGMIGRGFGRILNVGSTASFVPGPFNSVYYATKAYVLSFSEAIAEELKTTGVSVTVLCPGPTATNFAKRAQIKDMRSSSFGTMSAKKVARAGYRALMARRVIVVPGTFNKLQIFFTRFMPRRIVTRIVKFKMDGVHH